MENNLVFPDEIKPHALGALADLRTKVLRGTQVGMAPRWLGELLFSDLAAAIQVGVAPAARSRFDLTEIRFRDLLEKDGRTSDSDNSTWNSAYKQVDDALRTIANRLDQANLDRSPASRNGKQTAFGSAAEPFHVDSVSWVLRVSGPLHESSSDDKRANIRLVPQIIEGHQSNFRPIAAPLAEKPPVSGNDDQRRQITSFLEALPPSIRRLDDVGAPHELRPVPVTFSGRDALLAELVQLVSDNAITGIALRGLPGVGKTTFALAFAERLSSTHSSQLFIDLKGNTTTPLTPFDIMAHVIHAYRGGQRIPSTPADLSGLYYTILNEQHALLVFDNAKDAAQIQAVLPPKTCFLLVTSRHRFALPNLHPVELDPLRPSYARELLISLAPRCAEQAATLAELCGYLPIALCAAGCALAQISNVTPAEYVHRFRERRRRLELIDPASDVSVQASLALTHSLLPRRFRRRFEVLGVFRSTFDMAAAASIWRTSTDVASETLGVLARYSLLTYDHATDRYDLHDLVSAYADSKLSLLRRHLVATRHTIYFATCATGLETFYSLSQAPGTTIPIRVFQQEWPNIEVAFARLARWTPSLLAEVLDGCRTCLALSRPPSDRLRWLQAAAGKGGRVVRARLLTDLADAYFDSGEPQQAADCARQGLALSTKARDAFGKEIANNVLMRAERALGNAHSTILATEASLKEARARGNVDETKAVLKILGSSYFHSGSHADALRCFDELLALTRKDADAHQELWTIHNIARTYGTMGDIGSAIAWAEQESEFARQNNLNSAHSIACGFLALKYELRGDHERASDQYAQRFDTIRTVTSDHSDVFTLVKEAIGWADAEHFDRALALGEVALALASERGFREMEALALFALGRIHGGADNDDVAKRCFLDAARIAESSGYAIPEAIAKWALSLIAADDGDLKTALAHGLRAMAIVDKGYGGIFSTLRGLSKERLRKHIHKLQAECDSVAEPPADARR